MKRPRNREAAFSSSNQNENETEERGKNKERKKKTKGQEKASKEVGTDRQGGHMQDGLLSLQICHWRRQNSMRLGQVCMDSWLPNTLTSLKVRLSSWIPRKDPLFLRAGPRSPPAPRGSRPLFSALGSTGKKMKARTVEHQSTACLQWDRHVSVSTMGCDMEREPRHAALPLQPRLLESTRSSVPSSGRRRESRCRVPRYERKASPADSLLPKSWGRPGTRDTRRSTKPARTARLPARH